MHGSSVGQYRRSPESAPGLPKLRQLLPPIPKVAVCIPAGLCLVVLAALFRRAGCARSARSSWAVRPWSAVFRRCSSLGFERRCERALRARHRDSPRRGPDLRPVHEIEVVARDAFLPPVEGELLPGSETGLFERLGGTRMTFSWDSRGTVTGLTAHFRGDLFSFEKTSDEPPGAPERPERPVAIRLDGELLDACAGRFEFGPNSIFPKGIEVTITREGERLIMRERGENAIPGAISIYPESETGFFTKIDRVRLTFIKDAQER